MKKFVIIGAKWFDSVNGNTYHNAKIIDPTSNKIYYCGLVDYYNGGGSILDIQLMHDVKLNTNNIKLLVESIDKYTVDEIYGLCGSCFKDCVKITGLI